MKATGIVRRIDDLGRVVIPKEIRRTMRIREGDPLEIFTDKNGEVIFKKYSIMGEWSDSSQEICEIVNKTIDANVAILDRDSFIAASGNFRREFIGRRMSAPLEQLFDTHKMYQRAPGERGVTIVDGNDRYIADVLIPIMYKTETLGAVLMFGDGGHSLGEVEFKMAQAVAQLLSRQAE